MVDYKVREEIGVIDKQTARLLKDYDSILNIARTWYVIPSQAMIVADEASSIKEKVKRISEKKYLSGFEEIALNEIGRNASFIEYDLRKMPERTNITPKELIKIYSIPEEDLRYVETWLKTNKKSIQDSVDIKFKEGLIRFKSDPRIPQYRSTMEKEGGKIIENIFEATKYISEKTSGIDLNGIIATPTWEERAFYDSEGKAIRIGLPYMFFSEKGALKPNYPDVLETFGHEGFGHGRNFILTEKSNIPETLKKVMPWKRSTIESVAQYYSDVFIDFIKNNSDAQEKLGIENFENVYEEFEKSKLFGKFLKNRGSYAIHLISKKLPEKEIRKKLNDVSLNNFYATVALEKFTDKNGKLDLNSVVNHLIYSDRGVEKGVNAINNRFGKKWFQQNESEIDKTLLTGFWTPQGYKEMTELFIEENK